MSALKAAPMPGPDPHILQTLYDALPDPVIVADVLGTVLSANTAAAVAFARDAASLAGMPLCALLCADVAGNALANGGLVQYRRGDGTTFSAMTRSVAVNDGSGTPVAMLHMLQCPTEQPDDLPRQRAIDSALEAISEGIAVYDPHERLILCNTAYRQLFAPGGDHLHVGATVSEIVAALRTVEGLSPLPPGTPAAEQWLEQQVQLFRKADGRARTIPFGQGRWLRSENTVTADGNTVSIRVDVTDMKEIELALDRQRQDYATLVESIPLFIARISPALAYTFVNGHFATLVGWSPNAVIGHSVVEVEQSGNALRDQLRSLTLEQPMATCEEEMSSTEGTGMWVHWTRFAVFEGRHLIEYVTVGRDVTESKLQQLRIADQSAELRRKNEALGQFTSTVSHDLKAPLRHVSMFSEMIADDIADGRLDEVPVYAQELRKSARRMLQLVDSLLEYSRIADRIVNRQSVRVRDVVDDALGNLQADIAESAARIEIGSLPDVVGDPELLKRLFQNVIGNAIKYRRPGVAPVVTIEGHCENGTVRFVFTDNGIGVEPVYAEKIFEIFQRLHRDEAVYPGTGVGLSLAKRIADSHKGMITLDPAYRDGARFVVTMPAS
jgi:PAS domain S-box-containing protein